MARAVGGIAGAAHQSFTVVARVAAEAALVNTTVRGTIEGEAAVLQLVDGIDGFACQNLRRRLIDQIVTTLDGIVHVPFPVIFFQVAERGCHTALRCSSMRADGVDFAQNGDTGIRKLHGGHEASASSADDDHIEFSVHMRSFLAREYAGMLGTPAKGTWGFPLT